MAGTEIVWNSVSSTTIPELVFSNPVRELLGKHRGTFQEVPGRRGSWYFPEVRGRRLVTVPGFFQAGSFPTARRDLAAELSDWLDVDIEARLVLGDDPSIYYEAVLGDCGDITEWRELGQFEIQWHISTFAYAVSGTTLTFPVSTVTNTAFDPDILTPLACVVEITPNNGTIEAFQFGMNGDLMQWSGLINDDESLTINGYSMVVIAGINTDTELTGAYNPDLLAMADANGGFSSLVPGVNTLNWEILMGTATEATIRVTYRKAYRR